MRGARGPGEAGLGAHVQGREGALLLRVRTGEHGGRALWPEHQSLTPRVVGLLSLNINH